MHLVKFPFCHIYCRNKLYLNVSFFLYRAAVDLMLLHTLYSDILWCGETRWPPSMNSFLYCRHNVYSVFLQSKGLLKAFSCLTDVFFPPCRCRPSCKESRIQKRCSAHYNRPSVKLRGAHRNRWWAACSTISPVLFVLASCVWISSSFDCHSLLMPPRLYPFK